MSTYYKLRDLEKIWYAPIEATRLYDYVLREMSMISDVNEKYEITHNP